MPLTLLSRFRDKYTVVNSGCWEWQAALNIDGYGSLRVGHDWIRAHRVSYMLHVGAIPKNKCVLHKCNNTRCVNPSHLYVGTPKDNTRDSINAGTHYDLNNNCKRGFKDQLGETNHNAKLNSVDVICIKKMLRDKIKESIIRFVYRISKTTLWRIRTEVSWKHVQLEGELRCH